MSSVSRPFNQTARLARGFRISTRSSAAGRQDAASASAHHRRDACLHTAALHSSNSSNINHNHNHNHNHNGKTTSSTTPTSIRRGLTSTNLRPLTSTSNATLPISSRSYSSKHPPGFTPPSTADLDELRERVQDFVRREIPPELAASTDTSNDFPAAMWAKLGEAGFLGPTASEEHGGLALGYAAHCVILEELSRASASIGLSYAAHSQLCVNQLSLNGSAEQQARFLPALIAGSSVGALAMSEHGAGSDVVSMRTKAVRADGGWLLTGTKMWITNGPDAHVVVVYAKTDPEATPASRGITAFIVETRDPSTGKLAPGFAVAQKLDKLGMRGSNTGELVFEDVFVPDANVLGSIGGGVRVLMEGLDLERLVLSAGPLGIMQAALDVALPYVHQRAQFGKPIAANQLVQAKMADMYTKLAASRAYTYATARAVDEGGPIRTQDCAGAILYAAERATECALDAVQLMGGMGYMNEVAAGRLVRDAKLYEIGAGTSEIRRVVIGRAFNREFGVGRA